MYGRLLPSALSPERHQEFSRAKKILRKLRLEMRSSTIKTPSAVEERLQFIEKKCDYLRKTTCTYVGSCEAADLKKGISRAWSEFYDVFYHTQT